MRAPVSIVTEGESVDGLAAVMVSLGEGLEAGLIREVLVFHAGPGAEELAEAAGATVVATGLTGALAHAAAPWVLILFDGVRLVDGWSDLVLVHLGRGAADPLALPARAGGAVSHAMLRPHRGPDLR